MELLDASRPAATRIQQGQKVYVTEVVAENFQMLESRAAREGSNATQGIHRERLAMITAMLGHTVSKHRNSKVQTLQGTVAHTGTVAIWISKIQTYPSKVKL